MFLLALTIALLIAFRGYPSRSRAQLRARLSWRALLRDERGWNPIPDFKGIANAMGEVFDAIKGFVSDAVDFVHLFGQMAVNALVDGASAVTDLLTWFGTVFTNTIAAAAGAATDLLTWFGTVFINLVTDTAGALRDLLTWFGTVFVNVVTDAAGAARDLVTWFGTVFVNTVSGGFSAIIDILTWFGQQVVNVITATGGAIVDRIERVGSGVTEIPAAIKDGAAAVADKSVDAMFGLADAANDTLEANMALMRAFLLGDVDSVDDVLGALLGKKKVPGPLWDLITFPLLMAALASALSAMGGVAAEGVVQDFRRRNPKALFDPMDLRDAVLRGKVGEADARDQLQSVGFSAARAQILIDLYKDIPPPADLIRMAVREAFSPDVVARFGQNQDFPARFGELAEQQGISPEFSAAYWAAHWDLPSPQQGFEMFHRGVIDADTLQLLLRALDVMPFWREKLTDIAYNVVGRIDTRRLFQSGVWDRARVERSYLDQGYPPQEAADLTNWTVLEFGDNAQGSLDLTRAAIEKAFKQGRLARNEAAFALVELGYTADEADFLIANVEVDLLNAASEAAANSIREVTQSTVLRAYRDRIIPRGETESMLAALGYTSDGIDLLISVQDFTNENELAQLRAKVVEQEFRHGIIGSDVARARLAGAGIAGERADLIVQRWEIQFGAKDRDLTEAQLRNAMRQGIIDDVTYVLRIVALGYSLEDAAILLRLAGGDETPAVRELTSAQIVDAYKRGLTSRATAAARLVAARFDAADAELQLKVADQDLARAAEASAQRAEAAAAAQVRELARTSIEAAYKRGIIDRVDAKGRLVELGFAESDAELLLAVVDHDLLAAAAP